MKPTVIGVRSASTSRLPTVIHPTAKQSETTVARVEKPSVIEGGVQRKRIPTTRESLKIKYQQLKDSVLDVVFQTIQTTNQDTFTLSDLVLWGQPLQEKHNTLVSETLTLAQSEVVTTVARHVHRMLEILDDIKLDKVFEQSVGFIANTLRKASKEIDTPEELDQAFREIEQLSKLMQGRINELLQLRGKLESNSKQTEDIGDDIEASMIAALAFAEYFNQISEKDKADRLEERAASLTMTLGHIRSGGSMRDTHIEQPMNLTTLIQNVVFNTLPSWMSSVTALRMALHSKNKPSQTEISEISQMLKSIIQKIQ